MGIKTVAVHSVADANSLFVKVSRYIDKYRTKVHISQLQYYILDEYQPKSAKVC